MGRDTTFDIMKGMAILLVVIGHSIPDQASPQGIGSPYLHVLHSIIYSFHMPIFFWVSGYFSKYLGDMVKIAIWQRFKRLLIPYIVVGMAYFPFKLLLSEYASKPISFSGIYGLPIGNNPNGELWFLYALFFISVFIGLLVKRVSIVTLIASLVVYVISSILPGYGIFNSMLSFQFYFIIGRYMKEKQLLNDSKVHVSILFMTLFVFIIGNILRWYHLDLVGSVKLLTALAGILLTYQSSLHINGVKNWLYHILTFLGMWSMEIYILSDIIKIPFRILFYNKLHMYYVAFIVCTMMSLVLSVIISKYIKRSSLLSQLFFGSYK